MKIAFLGSRGIPAGYSGFETFYEQLALRLVQRGHTVTVYNRSHFIKDVRGSYQGSRLVTVPSIPTKHLDTLTHTLVSSLHALTQGFDIAYYCVVGNSPLVWIPRLAGARTLLNVDGEDWAREKWGPFARWYQRWCERIARRTADVLISDAHGVQQRYRDVYGVDTVFVPYGANVQRAKEQDVLARWGLQPRRYVLYVGRLVPENAIELLIQAFGRVETDMRLVIVGDAPYADAYKRQLHARGREDPRVVFTGYAFGRDYQQLSSHAYLYVQPSRVDGTRPALLDQLGFGNCVVVCNSLVNLEVIGDCGTFFDRQHPLASLQEVLERLLANPEEVEAYRARACSRIDGYYNWDWVTDFYEDLFGRMLRRQPLISYDEFLWCRALGPTRKAIATAGRSHLSTGAGNPGDGKRPAIEPLMNPALKRNVLGVLVDGIDPSGATDMVMEAAHRGCALSVSAIAVHGVMTGVWDRTHRYRLNHLDLVVADGQPVRWALNLLHAVGLRERVYGPNLMIDVLTRAAREQMPVYFYGSTQEVLELLCSRLLKNFPSLRIAGAEASRFARIDEETADEIATRIRQSGARIVFVGLGCPRQEVWAYEFRDRLNAPILAVGAAFPFLAGTVRQAPVWMQNRGLEWLFRLRTEPRRLWRRYLLVGPAYILLVLCQWLGFRFRIDDDAPVGEILHG